MWPRARSSMWGSAALDRVDRAEDVDPDHLLGLARSRCRRTARSGRRPALATSRSMPLGALREPVDGALHLAALGDVGDQRQVRAGRALGELRRRPPRRRLPAASHQPDRAPRERQRQAQGAADPARGAGDERPRAAARSARPHPLTRRSTGGGWPCVATTTIGSVTHEHATVAEEEYLQIIFWLEEAGLPITGANIARAMQLSAPTVHEMIGRLERRRLRRARATDKSLAFTADGPRARRGDRPPPPADRALPDRRPRRSPGTRSTRRPSGSSTRCRRCSRSGCWRRSATPRPARTATRSSRARASRASPLADVEPGASVHVLRFENEAEELLHYLKDAGLQPGLEGTLESSGDDEVVLASDDGRHVVSRSVAETVSVRADPSPPPRAAAARAAGAARATATAADVRARRRSGAGGGRAPGPADASRTRGAAPRPRARGRPTPGRRSAARRGCARSPRSSFRVPSTIVIGVISTSPPELRRDFASPVADRLGRNGSVASLSADVTRGVKSQRSVADGRTAQAGARGPQPPRAPWRSARRPRRSARRARWRTRAAGSCARPRA